MSEEQNKCSRCGTVRRLEDSGGLCPNCLLGLGMLNGLPDDSPKGSEEVAPSGTALLENESTPKDDIEDTDNLIGETLGAGSALQVAAAADLGVGDQWEFSASWPFLRAELDDLDGGGSGSFLCRDCHRAWDMDHTAVETYDGRLWRELNPPTDGDS